jgi:hypothetical protein
LLLRSSSWSQVSLVLSVGAERLSTLDASPSASAASRELDFAMTKLQLVYVVIGLLVALAMVLAMLPIGR